MASNGEFSPEENPKFTIAPIFDAEFDELTPQQLAEEEEIEHEARLPEFNIPLTSLFLPRR